MKTYGYWYEFSNGYVKFNVPLAEVKRVFTRLMDCNDTELTQFRFFKVKEMGGEYVTFTPASLAVTGLCNIKNGNSRRAIERMFEDAVSVRRMARDLELRRLEAERTPAPDKQVLINHLNALDLWDEIISMADERWNVGDNAVDDLVFCAIDCIYFEESEVAGDDEATRCMRMYDEYGEDSEVIVLIVSLATQKSTKEARAKAGEFWSAVTGS